MYLSKKASRYLALALVAIFFAVAIFLIRSPQIPHDNATLIDRQIPNESATLAPSASPSPAASDAQVTLTEFHRSEVKNGKKIWEIKATRGEYLSGGSAIRITDAILWLYRENADTMQLKAQNALIKIENAQLREAELTGSVELVYGKVVVTTAQAFFNPNTNTVTAPGPTKISSDIFETTGEGLSVDVTKRQAFFKKNVHSRVKPRGKNAL